MNFYTINFCVLFFCVIITPPRVVVASSQQTPSLRRSQSLNDIKMKAMIQRALDSSQENNRMSPPILQRGTNAIQLVMPVAFNTNHQKRSPEEVAASKKRMEDIVEKYKQKKGENKLFHSRATAVIACVTAATPFLIHHSEAQSRFGVGGGLLAVNGIVSMLPTITATLLGATVLYKINYYIHAEDRNNFNNLRRDLDIERRERVKGDSDTKQACMSAVTRLKEDMSAQNNGMTKLLEKAQESGIEASSLLQQVIPKIQLLKEQQGRMEKNVKDIILPTLEETLHQVTAMRNATEADLYDELDSIQIPSNSSPVNQNGIRNSQAGSWARIGNVFSGKKH